MRTNVGMSKESVEDGDFLRGAMEKALAKMADDLTKSAKASPAFRMMTHPNPVGPWPFGTVLVNPRSWKSIVVGDDPQFAGRFYGLYITGPDVGEIFSFARDDWEPVPEPSET